MFALVSGLVGGRAAAGDAAFSESGSPIATPPRSVEDLRDFSIDQLAQIQVTSVSKSPAPLATAPAAIYVITHDDIVRSGATSLPEILRLAPNLFVAQTSASQYVVTARGFSGNANAQNFADKLLVLIDGRSVYTPLYSGVYWDAQYAPPEDIDRIEVISGPGATLWGANAVNGVINIITRKSGETQGGFVEVGGGSQDERVSLQYGGRISDALTYRVYAMDFRSENTVLATGAKAHDHWSSPQGGFRLDWTPRASDTITLQGDAYDGSEAQSGASNQDINGQNLVARWNHGFDDGSTLQIQTYFDRTARETENNGGHFSLDTYDLDVEHDFALGSKNQVVWGGGLRLDSYRIVGTSTLEFSPAARTLKLANLFVQDTLSITGRTAVILGLKLEDDPYSGLEVLPSLRATWRPIDAAMVWGAVSRAVRSPTPFDRDVVEKLGPTVFLIGGPAFEPETLTAYEIGARLQPESRVSVSVSAFYNVYDNLRSIEPAPNGFLPLRWGNLIRGETYGLEAWGSYALSPWWRVITTFNLLEEDLRFKPGASGILGVSEEGDDPKYQASLRSSVNLGRSVTFDGDLRYVDTLPNPHVPSYVELNARLAWNVSKRVRLSVSGFNLLHDHHQEFPAPQASAVPRSVFADVTWRF